MTKRAPPTTENQTNNLSSRSDVDDFLKKVANTPALTSGGTSRFLFAMDSTATREPSWDHACPLPGQMFTATSDLGELHVQLCHYGGFSHFRAGRWCASAAELLDEMTHVRCLGGHTQIGRVLRHAQQEHGQNPLKAIIFVGDAVEENPDDLCHLAGQLGVLGIPLFMFQEGVNPSVQSIFKQMAQLSNGAFAPFNLASASQLRDLLSAVAVYATGGRAALERFEKVSQRPRLLTQQLRN